MNETQVNKFLRCLLQIDDLNYLALHARAAATGGLKYSKAQYQQTTDEISRDSSDHNHDHDGEASSNRDLVVAKVTAMVVLFCASTLCGAIPFMLNRFFHWTETHANARSVTVVKTLLYFGGGVLLATTFLHLLPEVQEAVEQLQECSILPQLSFSLAELLMCCGFFLMYLIEELLHSYIQRDIKMMEYDTGVAAAFERGRSIRCSYLLRSSNKDATVPTEEPCQDGGNFIGKLADNCNIKSTAGLVMSSVPSVSDSNMENTGHKTIQPGSLSMQDLIANDAENQKYSQHQYKERIPADLQIQHQQEERKTYDLSQPQQHQHHHHHHLHHQKQQHGHSHLSIDVSSDRADTITSSLRGLFIVLALSLHELFEGMAIGLESDASDVWFMFGAVSAHKLVLAFCVGVELIVAHTRFVLCSVYVLTFAVVSPIGIGIGILISHSDTISSPSLPSAILQGLACGTLLYVVFFEILSKNHAGLVAYFSLMIGFIAMFGVQQLGADANGHSHSSCISSDNHDHDGKLFLLKGAQNVYTTEAAINASNSQHRHQHHEISYNDDGNGNFERELKILRQASLKLIQNNNKDN
ncbi:uncharacterized protein LOC129251263 isoform X1 [Anastrepha obliqua]|uniref:uncharacterized protein LOC129251263 isoform X1 n=1 Tax=Anastrepha obliqua TaxID=95512 RepID=UPI00240A1D2B|nr:uncharacterized protein LOC129251263 isoform X1 [Anastrepha obliqua]XP_054746601.1 uncharacterized protein LOC129251263 isoform X1 [Anastrepha obliqua]XP_054746602.1 uncharacterized protein LOC129251263 isoform X1 [Anastrepha obliqua]XP_054746603.1 uncharacterized protein LOC129251263 isoform X1 [Anastrepha obliqua]XP_054746604.1 uncharacterized protein LOC129251263 isoform X1 [Anastrepha obliqua]XP_054746605.1 uncharacterized protein LOC129251263 isoform X1 [Anastrepha obliqua]XP_05474660